jgi:GDP-4-dehydro-6-deoxy-D-mannose reductase
MKIVVGRPFNIIGAGVPQGLVVGDLLSRAKDVLQTQANPIVRVGNLDSKRDFVAVDDVAEAYLQMIRGDFWGEVFNICSGNAYSIRKIVEMLLSNSERQISLEVDPNLVRSSEVNIVYGSNEKAQRLFGFDPNTDLDNALKSAWEYEIKRID